MNNRLLLTLILILSVVWLNPKPLKAADFDCRKARSTAETLICGDEQLSAADSEFAAEFRRKLSVLDDKDKARMVEGQIAWVQYRDISCGVKKQLSIEDHDTHDKVVVCLKNIYKQRLEFLEPGSNPPLDIVPLPFSPPSDWWGIDITSVLGSSFNAGFGWSVAVGHHGMTVRVSTRKPAENKPLREQDTALLDILSGHVIGTLKDEPQFGSLMSTAPYDRHGMKPLIPSFGKMPLDKKVSVVSIWDKCPSPFQYSFRLYDMEKNINLMEERYIVSQLQNKKRIGYESSRHCENDGSPGWTVDFTTLLFEPLGVFSDGTFLAGVGDRYIIRFRPDLTSDFFNGRRDIVLILDNVLTELPPDDANPKEALRAIHEAIEAAATVQMRHNAVH